MSQWMDLAELFVVGGRKDPAHATKAANLCEDLRISEFLKSAASCEFDQLSSGLPLARA